MLKNYFTTAFRNFWRNKTFTAINVLSLAIGICASLVIYLMVHYEFSFDKFEQDRERIYRVVSIMQFPDQSFKNSGVPAPLPAAARNEITGIEDASHFILFYLPKVTTAGNGNAPGIFKKQEHVIFADDHYFSLFHYQWLAGSPESFKEPNQVVLTESRAKLYFPNNDVTRVIGKRITYDDSTEVTVAGVVKDLDEITDFTFEDFISLTTVSHSNLKNDMGWDEWGSINSASQFFIKLNPGTSTATIEKQLADLRTKYVKDDQMDTNHHLQSLSDVHFNADYDNFDQQQADASVLFALLSVAAFLLFLGCVNFVNLNTANASQRAKEIGIRKTLGGSRRQLIFQFLGETFTLTFFSTVLSLVLVPWLLKIFSDFIPAGVKFSMVTEPHVLLFLAALMMTVTLVAGFYPALILSGYKPVTVMKNHAVSAGATTQKAWLRKSLTVTQFIGAQFFIIATILVSKQIQYSLNKDLGFRKDAIINIRTPYSSNHDNQMALVNTFKSIPGIEKVCFAGAPPAYNGKSSQTMAFEQDEKKVETTVQVKYGDSDYFNLYGMKLLAGRYLSHPTDSTTEYLINENYARFLGFQHPEDAIGKMLDHNGPLPIVGVLQDFNTASTRDAIGPVIYTSASRNYAMLHVLLKPQTADGTTWKNAINKMEEGWKQVYPEQDFEYHFYDETIASFYENEQQISRLLTWATALAILISCLGLFGLAIYTTNQRTKEIGVRKVLGATVQQIVLLLSKDFAQLIMLAFLIAVPLAWWTTHRWLENFAYRTNLTWWVFAAGGSMMLIISLTILSIRTIRAANANPVKSLRME